MTEGSPSRPSGFADLPVGETIDAAWPTPNHALRTAPDHFFARTKANPDYGKPGWTRECGKRFHQGCDVTPVRKRVTGRKTTVTFTDCATGAEYDSEEPTFIAEDPVFSVYNGIVAEAITDPATSDFGRHVVMRHEWPGDGGSFYSLYGHLADVSVKEGAVVQAGRRLGTMGATSRIADARKWMAVSPHLHFEVWNAEKKPMDPAAFLDRFAPQDPQ